ncbi:hypothetical protein [Komagataeibacter medellinensis]|uniref:hypothetical protein n=1 Tax=Komagataeibacter medellinensis TaxID=1177712 RepID=UPI0003A08FF3|nr:hypothetical protein [Komagataeibacter medellinensis]
MGRAEQPRCRTMGGAGREMAVAGLPGTAALYPVCHHVCDNGTTGAPIAHYAWVMRQQATSG